MRKKPGITIIVIGFIAAGAGGLWLAGQISQGSLAGRDVVLSAALLIVPITILVGVGIFMAANDDSNPNAQSAVELQRRMMEVLNSRGQMTINAMAVELGVSPRMVETMLEQLRQLDIFDGEVDRERGMLYSRQRER